MFKLKKIILLLVLVSPLIFGLLVGYPLSKNIKHGTWNMEQNINYSSRCFRVGVFSEFVNCFKNNKTIKGTELIKLVNNETMKLYSGFNAVLFLALIVQIALVLVLI